MPSEYNPNLIASMEAKFRRLNNPAHAMADAIGMLQMFPGIVGIWPGNIVGGGAGVAADRLVDVSGNGLHLSNNSNAQILYDSNLIAATRTARSTPTWWNHADDALFDILGNESYINSPIHGLTMGCWVKFETTGTAETAISKWNTTGNQRAYQLNRQANDTIQAAISSDGTGATIVTATTTDTLALNTWGHIVMRFDPSAELSVFLNSAEVVNTTSIPATIFNSSANFIVGGIGGAGNATARFCQLFLCRAAVPDIFIDTYFQMTAPLFGVTV